MHSSLPLLANRDAASGHFNGQDFRARFFNCARDAFLSARVDQKKDTTAASGPADFRGDGARAARNLFQMIDQRSGNAGSILAAMRPVFADEPAYFLPVS